MAEIDFFFNSDREEEILLCLSCNREECINCLGISKSNKRKNEKAVDQFQLSGEHIKTHSSMAAAARTIDVDARIIKRACENDYPARGYLWKYHEEGDTADV